MKVLFGIKIGGLQQKIFNLMLVFILVLIGAYVAVSMYQQRALTDIVQEASSSQQASIEAVSEETMRSVLDTSMAQSTALQAYIADDLFGDVKTDVLTLQAFATELFAHADQFSPHPFSLPRLENDGIPSVQMQHEAGVDPADSKDLGLVANMSEIMLAMYESSDKLNSCFVATTDGCILFADDRAGVYFSVTGQVYDAFPVGERPWYRQAAEAGELIFTGVELDTFSSIPGLVCAAPVYRDGELAAVVGADIFLTSISDYVRDKATDGGFVCVVNGAGQVLFSPMQEGTFKAELSGAAPDLRQSENRELAGFVEQALQERTELTLLEIDGREYYLTGAPLETLGWAVLSIVDKEITHQPTALMLSQYDEINDDALSIYERGAKHSGQTILLLTVLIL
ncbi:MAG: cache domain-containing protein, partial [Oscillospiraceae bacterium]|nr:cache domain-containing protein [Oscillospiraceae bacterium]